MLKAHMFFAHSIEGRDQTAWQPLAEYLQSLSRLTSVRAHKFKASRLGAVIGLLHDLGKYAPEFQDYIAGRGQSPDHATAGAREIQNLSAGAGLDRFAALIGAYCIAGHHGGLSNWRGERALSERLMKKLPPLDPLWQHELASEASKHGSALGKAPAHMLFDRVTRSAKIDLYALGDERLDNAPPARRYEDYEVSAQRDGLPEGIEIVNALPWHSQQI
jgi:CRISPR-associated endonuclease Cas3-HD